MNSSKITLHGSKHSRLYFIINSLKICFLNKAKFHSRCQIKYTKVAGQENGILNKGKII